MLYVGGFFNTNSYLRILALLIFSVGRFLAFAKKSTTLLFRQKEAVGFFYRKTALLRICFSKFSIRNCFLNAPYNPWKENSDLGASKIGVADILLRICLQANSQIGICIAPRPRRSRWVYSFSIYSLLSPYILHTSSSIWLSRAFMAFSIIDLSWGKAIRKTFFNVVSLFCPSPKTSNRWAIVCDF